MGVAFAVGACLAPMAHLLELPNKFQLDDPLWLAVQQNLYRGWGPIIGGPMAIGALAFALILSSRQKDGQGMRLVAATAYVAMLAVYFGSNAPVNALIGVWQPDPLPSAWQAARRSLE